MVKCLPEFEYFYCVLENKNIIFKIRRLKVTDYAALRNTPTHTVNKLQQELNYVKRIKYSIVKQI